MGVGSSLINLKTRAIKHGISEQRVDEIIKATPIKKGKINLRGIYRKIKQEARQVGEIGKKGVVAYKEYGTWREVQAEKSLKNQERQLQKLRNKIKQVKLKGEITLEKEKLIKELREAKRARIYRKAKIKL